KRRGSGGRGHSRTGRQLDRYLRRFSGGGRGAGEGGAGGGYSEWCCARIQAWWRMICARYKYRYLRYAVYGFAAMEIQYAWKNYQQNAIYDMSTR
ncbi:unnamed protein product, partial [Sphacelaria rigidula]